MTTNFCLFVIFAMMGKIKECGVYVQPDCLWAGLTPHHHFFFHVFLHRTFLSMYYYRHLRTVDTFRHG